MSRLRYSTAAQSGDAAPEVVGVDVGALLDEQARDVELVVERGHQQRPDAVGVGRARGRRRRRRAARAASSRPSRAAYSSGVMPPLTSARRPRSGRPPRLMPTPSDPQPVPLHGGTNAGVGPLRVCALTDAPASSRSVHGRRVILADRDHQRRLLELRLARVHAARRARGAARSAAGAPVRAAVISAVSPAGSTRVGIGAGVEQTPDHRPRCR